MFKVSKFYANILQPIDNKPNMFRTFPYDVGALPWTDIQGVKHAQHCHRLEYTHDDAQQVCDWLNEREAWQFDYKGDFRLITDQLQRKAWPTHGPQFTRISDMYRCSMPDHRRDYSDDDWDHVIMELRTGMAIATGRG